MAGKTGNQNKFPLNDAQKPKCSAVEYFSAAIKNEISLSETTHMDLETVRFGEAEVT